MTSTGTPAAYWSPPRTGDGAARHRPRRPAPPLGRPPGTFRAAGCVLSRAGTRCALGDRNSVPDGVDCPRWYWSVPAGTGMSPLAQGVSWWGRPRTAGDFSRGRGCVVSAGDKMRVGGQEFGPRRRRMPPPVLECPRWRRVSPGGGVLERPGTFCAAGCVLSRAGTRCALGDRNSVPGGVDCPRRYWSVPAGAGCLLVGASSSGRGLFTRPGACCLGRGQDARWGTGVRSPTASIVPVGTGMSPPVLECPRRRNDSAVQVTL